MWIDKLFGEDRLDPELRPGIEARFYRCLVENSLGLMCCHDLDGVLLWVNDAAARSLGYTPEEATGKRLDSFLAPEAAPFFDAYLGRIRREHSDNGMMRLCTKKGEERMWLYRNIVNEDPELPPHVFGHALDITEQFRVQRAFRSLFQQSPLGQLELDIDGKLLRINSAACKMLGYSENELLFPVATLPIADFFQDLMVGEQGTRFVIFPRRDGEVLHLEIHVRRVADSSLSRTWVSCALLDVSERVRADTKIRNLNAQLEARVAARTAELGQSNAELREFAFIASHDLQAPLQQVGKALEQIESKVTSPEARRLLAKSHADIQRMSMLVESLLSYAVHSNSAAAGAAPQVPLKVAIEESLLTLASAIAASHAVVTYEGLPPILVSEPEFAQLFQNLIGNALKYRSEAAPKIGISAVKSKDFWTISIEDNGLGIDPAYSERIFEAFRRLHGKEYAGSGIGLAICKKIVERAGGRIWVESRPGQGSIFRFTLPVPS